MTQSRNDQGIDVLNMIIWLGILSNLILWPILWWVESDEVQDALDRQRRLERIHEHASERYMKRYECENFGEMYCYE